MMFIEFVHYEWCVYECVHDVSVSVYYMSVFYDVDVSVCNQCVCA